MMNTVNKTENWRDIPHVTSLEQLRSVGVERPCICCSRPFSSRGSANVVCLDCRATAPEF